MHSRAISPGVSPRQRAAPPEGPAHQGLAAAWPSHGRRFASSGPPRPVGAARLDCLGPSRLTAKTSDLGYWISLDFLLVRIQIYQWVTRETRAKIFHGAFRPLGSRAERKEAHEAMRERGNVHGATLNLVLIFRNHLSSALSPRAQYPAARRRVSSRHAHERTRSERTREKSRSWVTSAAALTAKALAA